MVLGDDEGVSSHFRRSSPAPYLAGLRLNGRRVVVVGGGWIGLAPRLRERALTSEALRRPAVAIAGA